MRVSLSVIELEAFSKAIKGLLTDDELGILISYLALNPEAGDLMPGTGGARKLRWQAQGKGKRGGGRTIYYYHSEAMPLFLMDFYTKGAKSNLTEREKKDLHTTIKVLVHEYS